MKATPVNDFYAHGGVLREDGRLTHPVYLAEVKMALLTRPVLGPAVKDAHPAADAGVAAVARAASLMKSACAEVLIGSAFSCLRAAPDRDLFSRFGDAVRTKSVSTARQKARSSSVIASMS